MRPDPTQETTLGARVSTLTLAIVAACAHVASPLAVHAQAAPVDARACASLFATPIAGRPRELAQLIVEAYSAALGREVVRIEEIDALVLALDHGQRADGGAPLWRLPGLDGPHVGERRALREQLADNLRPAFESDYFDPAQRAEIVACVARELRDVARAARVNREMAHEVVATARELTERVSIGVKGKEHIWRRVTDPEIVAKLGESWQDESGLIWGDVVTDANGTPHRMTLTAALAYCQSRGATLPTREDFARLRERMGGLPDVSAALPGAGYVPQVLPNLEWALWSSSTLYNHPVHAVIYYPRTGNFSMRTVRDFIGAEVRCVMRR